MDTWIYQAEVVEELQVLTEWKAVDVRFDPDVTGMGNMAQLRLWLNIR
jgi:hypothetical protein